MPPALCWGRGIFHGEGLSVANAKEVPNYTAATTTHVAFQQHSRTTNTHRDQRVTVVGQQRELGLVDHLDHGRGEPLLGVEEVWIHVLDVDQKMLPRGQMETTPSVFAVRCDLVRVALASVRRLLSSGRPSDRDGSCGSSGRRPAETSSTCTWWAGPPSPRRSRAWVGGGRSRPDDSRRRGSASDDALPRDPGARGGSRSRRRKRGRRQS